MTTYQLFPRVFLIVFFVFFHGSWSGANDPLSMEHPALHQADQLLADGQFLEALSAYDSLTAQTTNALVKGESYFKMAGIYGYFLDLGEDAQRFYEKTREISPDPALVAEATFNCGMINYEAGRPDKARRYFETYVEKFPKAPNRMTAEFMVETCRDEEAEIKLAPGKEKVSETPRLPPECASDFDSSTSIRVLLAKDEEKLVLPGNGSVTITTQGKSRSLELPLTIKAHGTDNLKINRSIVGRTATITSSRGLFSYGKYTYRGSFIIRRSNQGMLLINRVAVEDYLRGVVPREMPPSWNKAALKAQAVCARTYALFHISKSRDKAYDVSATTASQVYGGQSVEKDATDLAVLETRGEVMCHNGKLIVACFHSDSGGHTEASKNVWVADLPYLRGYPDDYSGGSPVSSWQVTFGLDEIEKRLDARNFRTGKIENIIIHETSPAARAMKIEVEGKKQSVKLKGNEFRMFLDPVRLKSTKFSVTREDKHIIFRGNGYGHGVGLPQWSARKMGELGKTHREILKLFFGGVLITRIY